MNKIVSVGLIAALSVVAGAAEKTEKDKSSRESARIEFLKETGGYVVREDKGNGSVLIANMQSRIAADKISHPVRYMQMYAKIPVSMRAVDPSKFAVLGAGTASSMGATLVVCVKDDAKSTAPILLSPDEHWAVVNVAALNADAPGDEVLVARVNKGINRAICQLCGAGGSQYSNTMVGPFKNPVKDYDRFPTDGVPPDVFPRMQNYLNTLGVRQVIRTTYENACKRGWAPAPTNEYQKAIWDKVHQLPTDPIKIKYDPKRDK